MFSIIKVYFFYLDRLNEGVEEDPDADRPTQQLD